MQAPAAAGRRAHHCARRHGADPDPAAAARAAARPWALGDLRHARHRRRGGGGRPHRRDVCGRIVEEGSARELIRSPRHPYTIALLKSRAHGSLARGTRLETIGGAPPDLSALPPGCAFANAARSRAIPAARRSRRSSSWRQTTVRAASTPTRPQPSRRCSSPDNLRDPSPTAMPLHDLARAFVPYPDAPVPRAATGPLADLSFARRTCIKTRTAPTVQKLLDAGARFVGKTVTDELAFSMNGNNAHFGAPINGAARDRITGGSSSGSASAVSSNLCDFALGTDTAARYARRQPLRPVRPAPHAWPREPRRRARTRAQLRHLRLVRARHRHLCARRRRAAGPRCSALPERVRLLRPDDVWAQPAPAAVDALKGAADRVQGVLGPAKGIEVVLESFDAMYWNFRYLQSREAWLTDGPLIERYAPPLGPGVAERFAWSREVTDAQVNAAHVFRTAFRAQLASLLGNDGVLLMPTMPDIAPLRSDSEAALEDYRNRAIRMLCIAGLAGFPQLSMPLASREGAPLGISLLGPAGSDRSLVALAQRIAS
ncbi:amidase domain-containing protein [Ditylenchus destructor]|uniref:Amidase domain-containing protein n=1 Tax=Ditylenchus destructor TaxID=166010 RepID=A0AAD4QVG8_9BILA|nr:amidase domain-containing protein [Ditylenchus destructor]